MPTDFATALSASADLLVLADSSFPSGSHGHSTGLEYAIQSGSVTDAARLLEWGETTIRHALLPCDGRALVRAWMLTSTVGKADSFEVLRGLNEELAAFRPGMVQREGSAQVGRSFCRSCIDAWDARIFGSVDAEAFLSETRLNADFVQYPLAWGMVSSGLGIPLRESLLAYSVSAVRQMVQVAVRIMNCGQREALAIQAQLVRFLETEITDPVAELHKRIESAAFCYDSAGLGHESLQRRYFRT